MTRLFRGFAVAVMLISGLAEASGLRRDNARTNRELIAVSESCRPMADRLADARDIVKAVPAATSLDTVPTVIPYIWFRTNAPNIDIPVRLRAEYPTDMAIILENRYRDLVVTDQTVTVTVSFKGVWETLVIPWNDVIMVADRKAGREIDLRTCPER